MNIHSSSECIEVLCTIVHFSFNGVLNTGFETSRDRTQGDDFSKSPTSAKYTYLTNAFN